MTALSCSPVENLSAALGPATHLLLQTLAGHFSRLCHLTGQHSVSLTAFLRRGRKREVKGLVMLEHAATFLDTYKEQVPSAARTRTLPLRFYTDRTAFKAKSVGKIHRLYYIYDYRRAFPHLFLEANCHLGFHSNPNKTHFIQQLEVCLSC